MFSAKTKVPHAIIFLYDTSIENIEIPDHVDNQLVSYNEKCLSIGTQTDIDGDVRIEILDSLEKPKANFFIAFSGSIYIPQKIISVCTSEEEGIIAFSTDSEKPKMKVWVNHEAFPDHIIVDLSK